MSKTATMQPTLANVKKVAASYGAEVTLSDQGRARVIDVDLPAGKRWSANGCHCLSVNWRPGELKGWAQQEYADLLDRMSYGVDACEDPECDICHPERD